MSSFVRLALFGLLATCATASPVPNNADEAAFIARAVPQTDPSVAKLPAIPDRSTLMKDVKVEIVSGGKISLAQIGKIALPKVGTTLDKAATALSLRRRQPALERKSLVERATVAAPAKISTTKVFVNWDDMKVPAGGTLHSAMGPYLDFQVVVGPQNINGIAVTDSVGRSHVFGNMAGGPNIVVGKKYVFAPGEMFKSFFILSNKPPTGDQLLLGVNFTTSTGGTYSVTPSVPINVNGINNVDVGSGMLGQIRGFSKPGSKVIDAFNVNFVHPFAEPKVINIVYDSFTDNLFPAGNGETMSVGAQDLDSTNVTVAQTTTFISTKTVASTSSWDQTVHGNFGTTVSMEGEIGIPFLAKSKVSASMNFEVGRATTDGKSTTTTDIASQSFTLACPARKYCVGQASIVRYKIDTAFTATYKATTNNGETFSWPVRGQYKGADSTSARFVVQQFDVAAA